MKKLLSLILALTLLAFAFTACGPADRTPDGDTPNGGESDSNNDNHDTPAQKATVRLGGMTGPTSIGMVKLLKDAKADTAKNDYAFFKAEAGADIKAKLLTGELDIAAIPANLASALYNATEGEIQVIAVNTLGVVQILEKGETVSSFADLAGKKIYAPSTAKGAIPELVFYHLLKANNVDASAVTVEWIDASALAGKLKTEAGALVLTPQPAATAILTNVEGSRTALDLNEEWKKLDNGCAYITGVTVVRRAFAEANPQAVADFLTEYEASIGYANQNPAEAAALVVEFEILAQGAPLIQRAIPACNLAFLAGNEMKAALDPYIALLVAQNAQPFGGKVPAADFYYGAN